MYNHAVTLQQAPSPNEHGTEGLMSPVLSPPDQEENNSRALLRLRGFTCSTPHLQLPKTEKRHRLLLKDTVDHPFFFFKGLRSHVEILHGLIEIVNI